MKQTILKKTFFQNRSFHLRFLAYVFMVFGLTAAGFSLSSYSQVQKLFIQLAGPKEAQADYLILGKKLGSSIASAKSAYFTPKDIDSLKSQSFVKELYPIYASEVPIELGIKLFGSYLSSEIFFESSNPSILGLTEAEWNWSVEDDYVPLILPRSFLALFNLGYAASRGIPLLQEATLAELDLHLNVHQGNKTLQFKAKITQLTDRFSSFIAPQSFISYINSDQKRKNAPSFNRLALVLQGSFNPRVQSYLETHAFEIQEGKNLIYQASALVNILSLVLALLGLCLLLAAFILLRLDAKQWALEFKENLAALLYSAYSKKRLGRLYSRRSLGIQGILFLVSGLFVAGLSYLFQSKLIELLNIKDTSIPLSPIIGIFFVLLFQSIINIALFYRDLAKFGFTD